MTRQLKLFLGSLFLAIVGGLAITTVIIAGSYAWRGRVIEVYNLQPPRVKTERSPRAGNREVRMVTAYSALDSCHYPKGDGCLTASGKLASQGIVACPRAWKFGTKVQIGDAVYTCEDRLAKRYDHRIDIWFDDQREAIAWGRRNVSVTIIK